MSKIIVRQYISSIIALALLLVISRLNFLLFHTMAELFSIVITFAIFMFTWNTRKVINNNYLLFIGTALIFVGFLDLIHSLSYSGLNIIPVLNEQSANYPTQLWIAARYLQSISFFIAPFFFRKKLNIPYVITIYHLYIIGIIISIFYWQIFPDCCLNETELTAFKKISEIIISLILLAAIYNLWKNKSKFEPNLWKLMILAVISSIISELCFIILDVYGIINAIGHIFKIITFFLIYKAIIIAGIKTPLESLFYDLNQSRLKLLDHKNKLEIEVQKAVEEVEERNKMLVLQSRHAQLGEMIAAITHQWKQPLNQISVLSSALMDAWDYDALDEEFLQKSIGNISTVVNDMNNILDDFRNFYSPQTIDTDFELTAIDGPLQALVGRRLKKYDIDLRIDIKPGIILRGKVNEIIQVILILINNAVDAINASEIRTGIIELLGSTSEGNIIINVKDNAGGISKEAIDNVFDPYFTTKGDRGTGMGLFLARTIIEKHFGGEISVQNYTDGAIFTCRIPGSAKLDS